MDDKLRQETKRAQLKQLMANPFLRTANEIPLNPIPQRITSRQKRPTQANVKITKRRLPLYQSRISAGIPTPTEETIDHYFDLHQTFIPNPRTTFCVRVSGDSMQGAGIHDKDLLIVDTQKKPLSGHIVVASSYGELTVKRLKIHQKIWLVPENPQFKPLEITPEMDFTILGVVLHVIHSF